MNEEEKFDKLIRFKVSERDFPFDELNWEEAERLIIQQETKAKVVRFTLVFSAGIVAGALIMLPFILNNRTISSNTVATNSPAVQNSILKNSSLPVSHSTQTSNQSINILKEAPQPVQPAFVEKDLRTGTGGNSSQSPSSIAKISGQHSPSMGTYVNQHGPSMEKHTNGAPGYLASATISKGEDASNYNHAPDNAVSSSSHDNISESSMPPNISDKAGETATQAKLATGNSNSSNNNTPNNTFESNKNAASNNNSNNNSAVNAISESSKNNTINNNNSNNNIVLDNTSESNKNTSAASPNNSITKKDSVNNDVLPPLLPGTTPHYIHSDYSSNLFSIYGGAAYSFGWKNEESSENGSTRQASGITPLCGIYYTHYFGNISASLGIGYSELNNLDKTYTSSVTQYDFGADETVTTVTPQRVYYLTFPLKLQYDISSKSIVGINCNYLLMLTTYSTVTTSQQTYFGQTVLSSEKQNGYTEGFSNSGWQLGVSYTRMLGSRFGISAELYHDLGYIENNSFSNLTQNTKNNGLRLILSYQLIH